MSTFIILFILGFLLGVAVRPLLTPHKHDYELLVHEKVSDVGIHSIRFEKTDREWSNPNFKMDFDSVFVSYKKCKKCGENFINISNGTTRRFDFDFDMVKDKLDVYLAKKKEAQEKALFESVNRRIALTNGQVPYNPEHDFLDKSSEQDGNSGEAPVQSEVVGSRNPRNLQASN